MCRQPWPVITMCPSVSHCCTQSPCPLRSVLCLCLVHMWWGLLVLWSTQGVWSGWYSVIPTSSTITCVTSSTSSSSPAAAPMLMNLWFLLLWVQLSWYLASLSLFLIPWSFSISFTYHQIKVGPKPSAPWLHIITAGLFYRLGLLIHVKPSFAGSVGQGKFFSVFYAKVVPMLNPLMYSLRNKDVKIALKKTMKRITNWAEPFIPPFLSSFSSCSTLSSSYYSFFFS